MLWYNVAAYFFGGAFLANFAPHFIAGVSGRPFSTPFATPPFRGLSSPIVNTLYALCNLGIAYTLLVVVGGLELHRVAPVAVSAAGFGLWSIMTARSLTKIRGRSQAQPPASGGDVGGGASV